GAAPVLHRRADVPRHEFEVAIAELFGSRALPGGGPKDEIEDLPSLFLERNAVQDIAAVDVHVLPHLLVDVGIGGELDGGCRLAAEGGAPAGGETEDIGAARDLSSRRHRIVAGRIHEDEALRV